MKPSPIVCARLRFTTKQVGRGFYRGTRTGSMGAHTEYGGYVIDWRKVRHYNMPDLTDFKLTPFVTPEMAPTERSKYDPVTHEIAIPNRLDVLEYLRQWRDQNFAEFDQVVENKKKIERENNAKQKGDRMLNSQTGMEFEQNFATDNEGTAGFRDERAEEVKQRKP